MAPVSRHGLRAGDQIGNLEYVVDEQVADQYRRVVGSDGCYPNLMAEDCRAMLEKQAPEATLTTIWQRFTFLRPPIMGRRIQVGGWVREVREQRGEPWIRAAAFAVDDIGTEILRSEAAFGVGRGRSKDGSIVEDSPAKPPVTSLADGRPGEGSHLGRLILPGRDALDGYRELVNMMVEAEMCEDGNGLTAIATGWLESLLSADFGEDFRWGGGLSIVHHRELRPGSGLTCDGVVTAHDTDAVGVETRRVVISVRDAANRRVTTAEAVVKSPSPRLQ